MAAQDRTATAPIIEELLSNATRFSFFQLVRLLEQCDPTGASLGRQGPAAQEPIRFRSHASLAFPTADVEAVELIGNEEEPSPRFRVTVNFLGLYGTVSPLPTFYTEEIITTDLDESTRRHFLDLFHHRLISLFYRCWEKYRYYVQYRPGATDSFSQWMFALIGLGDHALREGSHLYWPKLLPFLGLLGMHTRSATVVAEVISHYFGGLPVELESCVVRWVPFAAEQRNALGQSNCILGEDSTLGRQFRDRSGKCRLHLGPLDFATFQEFLPPGAFYQAVRELMVFCMRDQLDFDVELILRADDVPDLVLVEDSPCRLGWSTWLGSPPGQDVSVVFPGKGDGITR